jgi:N-acyl-D-aspartate/D-glutamate deacylase
MQGCTTLVTGNCGGGPIRVGEYYRKIDDGGAGPNIAHLLPQGALRNHVIGNIDRKATPEEIGRMQEIVAQAMLDGAWGMSTGLIYVPSVYADTPELIQLASVVGQHGGIYASHIRGEGKELLSSVNEALQIGRDGGLPVHISHFKASGREAWGTLRVAADLIEQARHAGQVATADQYPYIASSTSLEATIVPTWARSGGSKEFQARLADAEQGPRLKESIRKSIEDKRDGAAIMIARYRHRNEWNGKSLKEIAEIEKCTPLEAALEIFRHGGAAIVNFSMDEDDVRMAMQRPWVATASDGSSRVPSDERPHPRSYGTFPRKIGYYALREKVVPVEQAIRSSSALPAEILGLKDRGRLAVDQFADVVVFDPKKFIDTATFESPHQYSAGTKYVFVNGHPAVHDGVPTGALAGRALRKPQPASEGR